MNYHAVREREEGHGVWPGVRREGGFTNDGLAQGTGVRTVLSCIVLYVHDVGTLPIGLDEGLSRSGTAWHLLGLVRSNPRACCCCSVSIWRPSI